MQNVSISLIASIQFFEQNYTFQAKRYAYKTFPDANDIKQALEWHKQNIIDSIEKAIKDYNPES